MASLGPGKKSKFGVGGLSQVKALQQTLDEIKRFEEQQQIGVFWLNESRYLENIVTTHLAKHYKQKCIVHVTRLGEVLKKIKEPERDCFISLVCRLAHLKTVGHNPESVELSNELLRLGFSCLSDGNALRFIDMRTLHEESYHGNGNSYSFIDLTVQKFLSAVYLSCQPIMNTYEFIKQYILREDRHQNLRADCEDVLQLYFGIADSGLSEHGKGVLPHLLHFLCQYINSNDPIIDDRIALLVISCLNQAQNKALCLQVHHEFFQRHIVSYNMSMLEDKLNDLAYYLVSTTEQRQYWTVYCTEERTGLVLKEEVQQLQGVISIQCNPELTRHEPGRVIISTKNLDYLHSVISSLSPQLQSSYSKAVTETALSSSALLVSTDKMPPSSLATFARSSYNPVSAAYGYLTIEQFENRKKFENVSYFNMVKDLMVPLLQPYCPTVVVQSQYRKGDHIWLSCSRNIRHDFYENVQISPISPLHWVKVKQPDGTLEMEERYKSIAMDQLQGSSTSSTDIAEIVLLNSHRYTRIAVTPLVGKDHVNNILLYDSSEEVDEPGLIGCDYLNDEYLIQQDVRWRPMRHFDILADEQIGRELPLPSKRGTESGDMTAITAAGHATSDETMRPQVQPLTPSPRPLSLQPPLPTSYEKMLGSTASIGSVRRLGEEGPSVSDQQIKRWALEAYDQPGQCFYGDDSSRFEVGHDYTLPDKLPHSRVLREGGNGLILEVYFEGVLYAVKRTAFRWREVLIMPKLRHQNILRLSSMLMGTPIEGYPRRRYVFHFYPRMTNDLGRMVGSYEKYCLRTLNERYRNEPLLLSKIHSNFRFITREILQGLHYLHTLPNPIVHRDVKPSNILVLTECDCSNPLACVCRKRPCIVLSDFDASLELNSDGTLQPDPARNTLQGFYTTSDRTYHISPVGTIGFKSPEGYIHMIGNSADVMPPLTTKADIFSFGLVMSLLLMNEEGPKYLSQMGVLLLAMNQRTGPRSSNVPRSALSQVTVTTNDIHRVLPIGRFKKEFNDIPSLITFMMRCLEVDPRKRASAYELLSHDYLQE